MTKQNYPIFLKRDTYFIFKEFKAQLEAQLKRKISNDALILSLVTLFSRLNEEERKKLIGGYTK